MPIIDNAVYIDGSRCSTTGNHPVGHGLAWVGMYRPSIEEVRAVAGEFGLDRLAVEDALAGHHRSKLERYGGTLFVVLRTARYLDSEERVEFGELHIFVGAGFVITIRHAESPNLGAVRHRLEARSELLTLGPEAVLYAILDEVVDEYQPVLAGLENDIDEIEDQLFGGHPEVSKRIYDLLREVIAFQRAVHPLSGMLEALLRGADKYRVDAELQRALRDVLDHVLRIAERADSYRVLLQNALTVHATLVTQQQNEEMRRISEASLAQSRETQRLSETSLAQNEEIKKISAWAAIFFAPTLIATIYGMNFDVMPELHWALGYPLALAVMFGVGAALYVVFKRRRWL